MKALFRQEMYPTGDGVVVILPPTKLVARRIGLSGDVLVREQVELAVESFAPLPIGQLFWGFLPSAERSHALVWVACRRHFSPEDMQAWREAAAVLPGQLLLCRRSVTGPGIVLHRERDFVGATVWNDQVSLPVLIIMRACSPANRETVEAQVLSEAQRRAGAERLPVTQVSGPVEVVRQHKGLRFRAEGGEAAYSWEELACADLRDHEELDGIRRRIGYARLAWRSTAVAALLLLLAGAADGALQLGSLWVRGREEEVRQRSAKVAGIEATHALAHRLHELSGRKLRLMEMMDALNELRPPGLRFVRAVSEGSRTLDLDIETKNADEARQYEEGLRALPELRSVQLSNMQTREGHTRFLLRAEFGSTSNPGAATMP